MNQTASKMASFCDWVIERAVAWHSFWSCLMEREGEASFSLSINLSENFPKIRKFFEGLKDRGEAKSGRKAKIAGKKGQPQMDSIQTFLISLDPPTPKTMRRKTKCMVLDLWKK